jgi:hypothetical protein
VKFKGFNLKNKPEFWLSKKLKELVNLTGLGRKKRQDIKLSKRLNAKEFVLKKKQDLLIK